MYIDASFLINYQYQYNEKNLKYQHGQCLNKNFHASIPPKQHRGNDMKSKTFKSKRLKTKSKSRIRPGAKQRMRDPMEAFFHRSRGGRRF